MVDQQHGTAATDERILKEILDLLRNYTQQPGTDWTPATTMGEIQVDSFGLVELVFEAEEKYGISVALNSNANISADTTVGDLANLVKAALRIETRRS